MWNMGLSCTWPWGPNTLICCRCCCSQPAAWAWTNAAAAAETARKQVTVGSTESKTGGLSWLLRSRVWLDVQKSYRKSTADADDIIADAVCAERLIIQGLLQWHLLVVCVPQLKCRSDRQLDQVANLSGNAGPVCAEGGSQPNRRIP